MSRKTIDKFFRPRIKAKFGNDSKLITSKGKHYIFKNKELLEMYNNEKEMYDDLRNW